MKSKLIHRIKSVQRVETKYGLRGLVELEFSGSPAQVHWVSPKQANKLLDCMDRLDEHGGYSCKRLECHGVFDDSSGKDRFVWCGLHSPQRSELEFISDKFGVAIFPAYSIKMDASPQKVDPSLIDEE